MDQNNLGFGEMPFNLEMTKPEKRRELRWFDVALITVVMFGGAIWSSTMKFLSMGKEAVTGALSQSLEEAIEVIPVFSPVDDLFAIIQELVLLLVVYLYLRWRRFDFSVWKIKPSLKGTGSAVLLFCAAGLMFDVMNLIIYGFEGFRETFGSHQFIPILLDSSMILFFFSLLNGFFEEIFFLGVCTAVNPRYRNLYLLYSILVRISFHTYQGIVSALGIGLILGLLYYAVWRRKSDGNLYSIMVAHAGADLIGLVFLPLF